MGVPVTNRSLYIGISFSIPPAVLGLVKDDEPPAEVLEGFEVQVKFHKGSVMLFPGPSLESLKLSPVDHLFRHASLPLLAIYFGLLGCSIFF